ncbi:hypothetical protein [Leadbettera azotonutricia]|uniref:Uncharacterized protein n=1 Tax=Leadbettera azotonutricia (strain ATCC BAA-888 / DSM 13862 / ZAS-9) TaxID=545695 RepID=F5YAP4_LEAAZ|nr:hypothetical protein [Leadbettera azotonutricia]AEF80604.1 hypothetical protein TREAZ_1961 [Leadbettera azotonutricia ZAS-9]
MPVEITIPNEGFTQAVRVGVREWKNAGDAGKLYPIREAWELYPAVSVPNTSGRMPDLPAESEIVKAFEIEAGKIKAGIDKTRIFIYP